MYTIFMKTFNGIYIYIITHLRLRCNLVNIKKCIVAYRYDMLKGCAINRRQMT